jgi:hypothetical protein
VKPIYQIERNVFCVCLAAYGGMISCILNFARLIGFTGQLLALPWQRVPGTLNRLAGPRSQSGILCLPQINSRLPESQSHGLDPRMSETAELCHLNSPLSIDLLQCNVKTTAKLQLFIGIRAVVSCLQTPFEANTSCTFLHWQGEFGAVEGLRYSVGFIFTRVLLT